MSLEEWAREAAAELGRSRAFVEDSDPELHGVRRCLACGAAAVRCVGATDHILNSFPVGRTYRHRCGACHRTVTLESLGRSLYHGVVGSWFGFLGALVVPATRTWLVEVLHGEAGWPSSDGFFLWLLFTSFLAFGVGHLVVAGVRYRAHLRFPRADPGA